MNVILSCSVCDTPVQVSTYLIPRGTGVLLGCQLGARWCLASSLTCDFNMIKNYTHDWRLLVAAYHASA